MPAKPAFMLRFRTIPECASSTSRNGMPSLGLSDLKIDGAGPKLAGTVTGANGSFSVSGSNNYFEAGSYPVTVTVTDTDGGSPVVAAGTATASRIRRTAMM